MRDQILTKTIMRSHSFPKYSYMNQGEIMKKVILTLSFLSLALAFVFTSANAQLATKIDADIPFDFVVGDKAFAAGKYVIRLRRTPSGAEQLEMRDSNNRVVYEAFAMPNGDPADKKPELIFDRSAGQAVLAKIRTEDKGFSVAVEKPATVIAAKEKKKAAGIGN